jgi:hypothetical protein
MTEKRQRIAILDSGVHLGHPHVGGITGGISITSQGISQGFEDRLGHGTAIAALIHHLNPTAELVVVRLFEQRLSTSLPIVLRAIDWCLSQQIDILNLSLGTHNEEHRAPFEAAARSVLESGAKLVSAFESECSLLFPGSLPGVIGVISDPDCPEGTYRPATRGDREVVAASPYPRAIPGVPREHNLQGVSFAVATVSAHLPRIRGAEPHSTPLHNSLLLGI